MAEDVFKIMQGKQKQNKTKERKNFSGGNKMSNNSNWGSKYSWGAAFSVASVWFGTHVGGGFASGNQVIQYFAQYGVTAIIYPILAMSLLAYVMYIMMTHAKLIGANNYKDTFASLYPQPWMEVFFEIFYIVILLAAMASAVAGAGQVFANFLGIEYVGSSKILCNLLIVAVLIVLTIFGVKLVIAASTVLSAAILVVTAIMVITGLTADFDSIKQSFIDAGAITEVAAYTSAPATAIWKGIIVYAAFQCVSIAPLIAASDELSAKGVKRAAFLGGLMNGGALAVSGWMLWKWYPLLAALQGAEVEGYVKALGIPNQTVLTLVGIKWVLVLFSVLLFCAFVSTCVTLTFSMVQRFQGYFFPKAIKNEKVRGVLVGAVTIAVCFAISLLGLTGIVKYAYGYCGYYAIVVIIIPAFVWGISKNKKLAAAHAAEEKAE